MPFKKGQKAWNEGISHLSEDAKKRISKANTGRKHTEESKKKRAESRKGYKHSEETKIKISNSHKGKIISEETKRKTKSYRIKYGYPFQGKKHSKEWKSNSSDLRRGQKNPQWKGGITPLMFLIRGCFKYRQWRSDIFERDNYTCQMCGDKTGGNLNADHIKKFSDIFYENKITSLEQALVCEEFWNINNGRTLCEPCHIDTDTFGNRKKSYAST